MEGRPAQIERALRQAFRVEHLSVEDESHRHRGHPGARDGRGHFRVEIVAPEFEGLSRLARHRAVYAALDTLLRTDIHALAVKAFTPSEWDPGAEEGAGSA